jgi:hypothetical protein
MGKSLKIKPSRKSFKQKVPRLRGKRKKPELSEDGSVIIQSIMDSTAYHFPSQKFDTEERSDEER